MRRERKRKRKKTNDNVVFKKKTRKKWMNAQPAQPSLAHPT